MFGFTLFALGFVVFGLVAMLLVSVYRTADNDMRIKEAETEVKIKKIKTE